MLRNNHPHHHLTSDEIERYINATEKDFSWNNLAFFEEFEKQLENCTVCNKRFRTYALLFSLTGTEEDSAIAVRASLTQDAADAIKKNDGLFERLKEWIADVGTLFGGGFDVSLPMTTMARGDGTSIDVKPGEGFTEFGISGEGAEIIIRILPQIDAELKYKLYIWNAVDLENSAETAPFDSYDMAETLGGGMIAKTNKLKAGEYIAAIVEIH